MSKETKNEVAKVAPNPLTISDDEFEDMFGTPDPSEMAGLTLTHVSIIKETGQFKLSEGNFVKTLTGHILHRHKANQWWAVAWDQRKEGESGAPNCVSMDGTSPTGGDQIQSEFCTGCARDAWGSDGGKGKSCRNTERILFLPDGAVLPVVITAPPTSLNTKESWQQWKNSVPNAVTSAYKAINPKQPDMSAYWPCLVELSLRVDKFANGNASILQCKTLDVLVPDTKEHGQDLRNLFQMIKKAKETYQEELKVSINLDTEKTTEAPAEPGIDPSIYDEDGGGEDNPF